MLSEFLKRMLVVDRHPVVKGNVILWKRIKTDNDEEHASDFMSR